MNIPALSERTLRRDIASGEFTTGPEIQVSEIFLTNYVSAPYEEMAQVFFILSA